MSSVERHRRRKGRLSPLRMPNEFMHNSGLKVDGGTVGCGIQGPL